MASKQPTWSEKMGMASAAADEYRQAQPGARRWQLRSEIENLVGRFGDDGKLTIPAEIRARMGIGATL